MFSRSIWLLNLTRFFLPKSFVLCVREVCKLFFFFTEIKQLKTVFNFFVFCLKQKLLLKILTISQVNFYQINSILWFYESLSGDFKQNANKVDFILKNVYIET